MNVDVLRNLGIEHNVSINVYDEVTHKLVQQNVGHNAATNSILTGIAHYLVGDGVLNQGWDTLRKWVPQYISLGTMGLLSQDAREDGLPARIGSVDTDDDQAQCESYLSETPGFGADGYSQSENNYREYFGLGPTFDNRPDPNHTINCELVLENYSRSPITYREIIPETAAELPRTLDIVYSAMVSTGQLAKFREPGKDYIYITEAGLWSNPTWTDGVENGMLAGYRIIHNDRTKQDMSIPENRDLLRSSILRVGKNQVVQIVWKIQIGSVNEFGGGGTTVIEPQWIDPDGHTTSVQMQWNYVD